MFGDFRFMRRRRRPPSDSVKSFRAGSFPFISGDTFRLMSHVVIDDDYPEVRVHLPPQLVFSTVSIANEEDVIRRLDALGVDSSRRHRLSLVLHNSDAIPDVEKISRLAREFRHVYCQNLVDTIHNATALPIGIENSLIGRDAPTELLFSESSRREEPRQRLVHSSFHQENNFLQRREAAMALAESRHGHQPFSKRSDYYEILRSSKFIISPPGNGPDCHRTWMAIYFGAVPVTLRGFLSKSLTTILPILEVDSYRQFCELTDSELHEIFDEKRRKSSEAAYAPYWVSKMIS